MADYYSISFYHTHKLYIVSSEGKIDVYFRYLYSDYSHRAGSVNSAAPVSDIC